MHGGNFDSLKFELLVQVLYGDIKVFLFLIVTFRNVCWNLVTSIGQTTSKYLYAGDTVAPGKPILLSFNSIIITIRSCRGLNIYFVPLGLYGIDLRQHPQAQLIGYSAGLDDIPERLVGSR